MTSKYYSDTKEIIKQGEEIEKIMNENTSVNNMQHVTELHAVVTDLEKDEEMAMLEQSAEYRFRLLSNKTMRGRCFYCFVVLLEFMVTKLFPLIEFAIVIMATAITQYSSALDPNYNLVTALRKAILVGTLISILLYLFSAVSNYLRYVPDKAAHGGHKFVLLSGKTLLCDLFLVLLYLGILSIEITVAIVLQIQCTDEWVCTTVKSYFGK